ESVRTLLVAGKRTEATELVRQLRGTAAAEPAEQLLESSNPAVPESEPDAEDR
ncbi:MAG: hypothetical protein HRU16_00110, partial [Planctomycetes bacterium]|nr:hypothetical protein [Planctomycetota bacterium]